VRAGGGFDASAFVSGISGVRRDPTKTRPRQTFQGSSRLNRVAGFGGGQAPRQSPAGLGVLEVPLVLGVARRVARDENKRRDFVGQVAVRETGTHPFIPHHRAHRDPRRTRRRRAARAGKGKGRRRRHRRRRRAHVRTDARHLFANNERTKRRYANRTDSINPTLSRFASDSILIHLPYSWAHQIVFSEEKLCSRQTNPVA
jgi:hypothetical protein